MKLIILAALLPTLAHAFTLNNSIGARFKQDRVKIRVTDISGNCNGQGTSTDELVSLINPAVKDFWNTVPTSRLQLEDGGYWETSDNNFVTGELCLSGVACGGTPIPEVTEIVITCNTNTANFPGGSSLLALTLPTVIKGKYIRGSVIAINATNGSFGNLSRARKIAVISHEIGHAIGLGHSDDSASLMYYTLVPSRSALGEDDFNGVTYLYPMQLDFFGLDSMLGAGNCGTVSIINSHKRHDQDDDDSSGGTGALAWCMSMLVGLAAALLLKKKQQDPQFFNPDL